MIKKQFKKVLRILKRSTFNLLIKSAFCGPSASIIFTESPQNGRYVVYEDT